MIFVTVGAQMPFNRLVRTVDQWAVRCRRSDVFAQIGPTNWRPSHIQWTQFLDPAEFKRCFQDAQVVVAHAGVGSIIAALELDKPLLVMPRRADLKETRNDHQVATARRFLEQGRIAAAFDEWELMDKLDHLDNLRAAAHISGQASPQLIGAIQAFIHGEDVRSGIQNEGEARMP